ncbi:MAG: response regulator [Anaerolineales bacterium]|nr:response regulator [Anaerolineales bacterium]
METDPAAAVEKPLPVNHSAQPSHAQDTTAGSIFVVDDEPGILRLCHRLLERAGFQTLVFNDPRKVLVALEELPTEISTPLDLLLVDIRMPELDGFQVIETARHRFPDLAVVVMTGFGTVDTAIEALRKGADGLILKPFSGGELVQSVRRALQQSRSKQDVARLQALRPLFDITESLFAETNPKRLQTLILQAVLARLPCSQAEFYQTESIETTPLAQAAPPPAKKRLAGAAPATRLRLAAAASAFGADATPTRGKPKGSDTGMLTEPIARQADTLRAPLLIQREKQGSLQLQEILISRQLGSVMCAPVVLKSGAALRGVLLAARRVDEPRFRESDLEMFTILARQAAVAMDNARLQAELRQNIRQLEDSQRALIQAEKMAIAGRLTASIAHEINNPLQSVQNCLHLAGRQELPPDQRESYLSTAQSELERLMFTVQRMLDYYRPTALDRKPLDISNLLDKVLTLASKQLADLGVDVHLHLQPKLPPILAVSDQIQQVFLNLILNAMQAMSDGGTLHITASLDSTNPDGVEIFFEDTGPGVPASQRKHIFEPFVSTKEQGAGLGLAVSYGIITAHGGSLDLVERRQPGSPHGACFRINLPMAGNADPAHTPHTAR